MVLKKNLTRKQILSKTIKPIDLEVTKSVHDLMEAFQNSSFQSRNLFICADIYRRMLTDPVRPTIMLGMSGALIAGGLRKILTDLIKYGFVDLIVTTGAIVYQDLYQALGNEHYQGTPQANDEQLWKFQIDRIYDTYVDERKFRTTDIHISKLVNKLEPRGYSTREFLAFLGSQISDQNSILYNASKFEVPIFCPAIADSSIGIGLTVYFKNYHDLIPTNTNTTGGVAPKHFYLDTIQDNFEIAQIVAKSNKTAAIYLGGGVPKNYINDSVVMADMLFQKSGGHKYAFQLTMDRPEWGGLSGSTLGEAQSWGKINVHATKATANVELTVGLPLIVGYLMHKDIWKNRNRLSFKWESNGKLKDLKSGDKVWNVD